MNFFSIEQEKKKILIDTFKCTVYPQYDWARLIYKLKRKNKDDIINTIDKVLRKSYRGLIPYPKNGCDFASDFGFMVFKDLGYEVKILQNFNDGEHNFLLVDNEPIDFTSEQFEESLQIRNIDLNHMYYKNSKIHEYRTQVLNNVNYEWFAEEAKKKTIIGVMNYIPFSYIIENLVIKNKKL